MKQLTIEDILRFAARHAGKKFETLKRGRPFTVDVVDSKIVFYPGSGRPFRPELRDYVLFFNKGRSLSPGEYPGMLWSRSYFVSLVSAMLSGEKIPDSKPANRKAEETPEPPSAALEKKVKQLRRKGTAVLPLGQESPKKKKVISMQIVRDPTVKAWILEAARGKCDLCRKPAPFRDEDGFPFLEAHHVKFLVDGGSDTITNAVALCPNCHRACHHSRERRKLSDQLYDRHARLRR